MKVFRSVDLPLEEQIALEGYATTHAKFSSANLGDPAKLIEKFQEGNRRIAALLFDIQRPDPTMIPRRRAA